MRSQAREVRERREREKLYRNLDRVRQRCLTFAGFVQEAWHVLEPATPLKWSWHMQAMCDHLEAISRGVLKPRLIINVPPGSSKSMIVSVFWQAWMWGPFGKPSARMVSASFELGNAKRDTRKTRDLLNSEWYHVLWPEVFNSVGKLQRDGATSFENAHRGTREGVAFAALTGKRGDFLVIDDPHSVKGGESEADRTETVRVFIEGGLNRLNDQMTSAIIIVMQRIHEADLSGELLARHAGFIHLMIPMEFEVARRCTTPLLVEKEDGTLTNWTDPRSYEGELMDPERMPPEALKPLKLSDYSFAGQYQQRPAPREGGMFKVDKIGFIQSAPAGGESARGWDLAGTKRKTSAFTAGVLIRRVNKRIVIEHAVRDRLNPYEVKEKIKTCAIDDGIYVKQSIPQDPGQAGVAQRQDMADHLAGLNFRFSPETGDKQTRATPLASAIEAGIVDIVKGDWNSAFVEELRNFPNGTYKDQVDAAARAYNELVGDIAPPTMAGPELVHVDTEAYYPDLDPEFMDDPWK